jgi:hypothetical protein
MIQQRPTQKQASTLPMRPDPPRAACPDVQCCPTCGRPYFGPQASGLLDLLILAQESISRAKQTLESVVMP